MKKRYILLAGMCVIGMLAVGCGSKETTVEVTPTPTPTIEVSGKSNMVEMQQSVGIDKTKITKIMGTKTATSAELVITNNTGLEIDCFYTRPSGEEDWSEDYIQDKFTLLAGEQALFYYDPAAKDENGVSITKYDLKVSYTDEEESDCMFRNLTLSDIEELKLKMEDGIPFVTYTSLSTKQEVSTLEDAKARMKIQKMRKTKLRMMILPVTIMIPILIRMRIQIQIRILLLIQKTIPIQTMILIRAMMIRRQMIPEAI